MSQPIEPGFMVFLADGQAAVGAVRELKGTEQLVVNVENGGDFIIATGAVRDVHEDKVIVDVARLPLLMQEALQHLHDAQFRAYRAADPEQGMPE